MSGTGSVGGTGGGYTPRADLTEEQNEELAKLYAKKDEMILENGQSAFDAAVKLAQTVSSAIKPPNQQEGGGGGING